MNKESKIALPEPRPNARPSLKLCFSRLHFKRISVLKIHKVNKEMKSALKNDHGPNNIFLSK